MKKFKTFSGQKGFFGEDYRLIKLSKLGDKLLKLKDSVNWEIFRKPLEKELYKGTSAGGRPPYDYVIMMKIIILQRYYNLSDNQMEFQLNDRLSFQRFLDISINDDVPDATTIWKFKEQIKENKLTIILFRLFLKEIQNKKLIGKKGSMIDASFVDVPKQRNTKDENKKIKNGEMPEEWDNPNKIAQKDIDARWTKKNKEVHFGYKDHVKADVKSKIITDYTVTSANVHDSQELDNLLDKSDTGRNLYADSAYKSKKIDDSLKKRGIGNKIIERAYRKNPLTKNQIKRNKKKSSIRVRVEHIFGFIENSMNGSHIRSIGKERADVHIGLMNLTYNIFRSMQLT